jgi:ketosteroid isomerase-like protein
MGVSGAMDVHRSVEALYAAFNRRDVEAVLARLSTDVEWANGMEGGHVRGVDQVRAYWQRQFEVIRSTVEPVGIRVTEDASSRRAEVDVHQVVRDAASDRLLSDTRLVHLFTFRGDAICRFDIVTSSSD